MVYHPRENWNPQTRKRVYTRRDFLQRAAVLGITLPVLPSLVAACARRGTGESADFAIGTPTSPVEQPLFEDNPAIEAGLPSEEGPLKIYNWADYVNPDIYPIAEEALGVEIEVTTFFNLEEAIRKLASGEVTYDVWFPTSDNVAKAVTANLIQPLNHDYLPNLANVWPALADPYYDQGSRYTVPYVLYSTGVAWRIDMVDSADVETLPNVWDIFWNEKYKGVTGLYDSFTDTIPMALFRNGVTDPIQATQAELTAAGDGLIELVDLMNILYTIDGAYVGIPESRFGLHLSWSGDIINSQYYFPEGGDPSVVRYVWPPKIEGSTVKGAVSNDTMAVVAGAEHPVLAHKFIDFMLDADNSLNNFSWLGYQPPQITLDPETMVADEWIPEVLVQAVVTEEDFTLPLAWVPTQLDQATEQLWLEQWNRAKAGG